MLKNSKFDLFLSPLKVGQAGNFWTLVRMSGVLKKLRIHSNVILKLCMVFSEYESEFSRSLSVSRVTIRRLR